MLAAALLLLRVIELEDRSSLSRRNAVLSAAAGQGLDPAAILRCAREGRA